MKRAQKPTLERDQARGTVRARQPVRQATKQTAKTVRAPDAAARTKRSAATTKPKSGTTSSAKPVAPARTQAHRRAIAERLARAVPEAVCELRFEQPWELLIATILAAQSTDKTVNAVMPSLLARYPTPRALAEAPQEDVEEVVKRTGFFRNKAKAIRAAAAQLVALHGGEVPKTIEEMVALPGVARKTANVVLGTAYRIGAGFVVDTHVTRLAQRLGLSVESDPVRIERDLCGAFPAASWIDLGHRMVLHGRYTCLAKKPECMTCPLNELCPSRLTDAEHSWTTRADAEATRVNAALSAP